MLYLNKVRISVWKFADCCAPSIALGIFLTRIGCFMNGCCFGKVSDFPWTVQFPHGSGPYIQQLMNGQISGMENLSLPIHPTQIYHSIAGFVLFLLLTNHQKYKRVDGQLFLIFAALYSLSRFLVEFYRGDVTRGFVGFLSLPQIFSLVVVVFAGYFLFLKFWKKEAVSSG
jgi:phosphatidylglycerol:prolipoprotein diacylglycerol transferase